jgi:hypothetical protein
MTTLDELFEASGTPEEVVHGLAVIRDMGKANMVDFAAVLDLLEQACELGVTACGRLLAHDRRADDCAAALDALRELAQAPRHTRGRLYMELLRHPAWGEL